MEHKKILIGCTGSVAAIKIGEIIDKLLADKSYTFEVSCIFEWNEKDIKTCQNPELNIFARKMSSNVKKIENNQSILELSFEKNLQFFMGNLLQFRHSQDLQKVTYSLKKVNSISKITFGVKI